MGFFKNLFRRNIKTKDCLNTSTPVKHTECNRILELKVLLESLFTSNRYISKKEYRSQLMNFEN